MINFVIYEDDKYFSNLYENTINKFMINCNDQYKIYKFYKYDDKLKDLISNLVGHNIYILDIEVSGKSGLDLAREIRNKKDIINNQIVIVTAHEDLVVNAFHSKILMLDFISKFDNLEEKINECFKSIYEYFNKNTFLSFKQDGELVRIPYADILFIEKDKIEDCLYIRTNNKKIKYNGTIANMEKLIQNDIRFFKTHRSCIVNTYRITKIDFNNSIIYFGDITTEYLSRNLKKELEKRCL